MSVKEARPKRSKAQILIENFDNNNKAKEINAGSSKSIEAKFSSSDNPENSNKNLISKMVYQNMDHFRDFKKKNNFMNKNSSKKKLELMAIEVQKSIKQNENREKIEPQNNDNRVNKWNQESFNRDFDSGSESEYFCPTPNGMNTYREVETTEKFKFIKEDKEGEKSLRESGLNPKYNEENDQRRLDREVDVSDVSDDDDNDNKGTRFIL